MILHDQEELFKSGKSERAIALARAKRASARADLILPVTAELAAAYEIDKEKTKIMRPIPGSRKDIVIKECRQKLTTSFVFSGSYFDTYFSALVRIAMVAAEESGTLTIISDNSRLSEKFRAMGCKNVHVIKSFSTNDEAVQYVADSGATFVVIYPAQLKSHAWAATSFPSKFVDFVRAEVPILVIAPKETPIARWCLNNNWGSYIRPTLSMCEFRCSLRRLMTSESWDRGAKQSRLLSMGEFSQETIQKHFEDGILAVIR